jgi:hypothetical protein
MKSPSGLIRFWHVLFSLLVLCCTASPGNSSELKARIQDLNGKPVEGVKVFLYVSTNVRTPADFISAATDKNGTSTVTVPSGKYWAVARLKKDAVYGPLMPGDKHSGEPVELEIDEKSATEAVFVVADIREIGQKKRTENADMTKLWGRIVDNTGRPVAGAYVFANRGREMEFIPEYLSAWTDESGSYTLLLPSGDKYYIGSAKIFPPPSKPSQLREFEPKATKLDVATDIPLMVY